MNDDNDYLKIFEEFVEEEYIPEKFVEECVPEEKEGIILQDLTCSKTLNPERAIILPPLIS